MFHVQDLERILRQSLLCGRASRMEQYSCSCSWSRHFQLVQTQTKNLLFSYVLRAL